MVLPEQDEIGDLRPLDKRLLFQTYLNTFGVHTRRTQLRNHVCFISDVIYPDSFRLIQHDIEKYLFTLAQLCYMLKFIILVN